MPTSQLVSGAGMFLNFLTVLGAELEKAGGFPWMLYFAQKKHAQPMMELLAKTIVESRFWRVPKSLILEEIIRHPRQDPYFTEEDTCYHWWTFSKTAQELTTLQFCENCNEGEIRFPADSRLGIYDPTRRCGDIVKFQAKSYVVTYYEKDEGDALYLAPAEYFDLEG